MIEEIVLGLMMQQTWVYWKGCPGFTDVAFLDLPEQLSWVYWRSDPGLTEVAFLGLLMMWFWVYWKSDPGSTGAADHYKRGDPWSTSTVSRRAIASCWWSREENNNDDLIWSVRWRKVFSPRVAGLSTVRQKHASLSETSGECPCCLSLSLFPG